MNITTKSLSFADSERIAEGKCEQSVSIEVNLPDYCSDIKRILKCIVTPGVSGISLSGENINMTGLIVTRLIYVGEDDRLDCYEQTGTLSCSTQMKNLPENVCLRAKAKTDYINCRALSQRRISISGSVGVSLQAYGEKNEEILSEISGCNAECKRESIRVRELLCQREKTFDLSETVALGQDKPDIAKILRCSCCPVITSQKAVSDKLLIKGELRCEILYCAEKDMLPRKISHTMPISQILDMPGIDEKSLLTLSLSCRQSACAVKTDSSGKGRLLEIAARVSAFVKGERERELSVISDCYCTDGEIRDSYKLREFPTVLCAEEKRAVRECTADFSSEKIKEIYDMWHKDTSLSFRDQEGEIICCCDFLLCGIFLDGNSSVRYAEKNCSVEFPAFTGASGKNIKCEGEGDILSLDFSVEKEGSVRIRCEIGYYLRVSCCESKKVLSEICPAENQPQENRQDRLILFFAERGQPLWEIGKKYKTAVRVIKEENSLETDVMERDGILLIPR